MQRSPLIALLTDFGSSDGYVASMKAVILSQIPSARIVDIAHDLPPHAIDAGAYVLWSCHTYFPGGTIFVIVVDPGVGSERKIIGVRGSGFTFLAPDNGLLKFILGSAKIHRIVEIAPEKDNRRQVSTTFHGRDIIAPVAASLAAGKKLSALGPEVEPMTKPHHLVRVDCRKKNLRAGSVIHIDRFGNVITDFMPAGRVSSSPRLEIGRTLLRTHVQTYADGSRSKPFLVTGSTGLIEISLKNGNAAQYLRARVGQQVRFRP